jgi:ParB-like chromosome segregation protein Spo0J
MERGRRSGQGQHVDLELKQLERRHADLRIADAARQSRLLASLAERGQQVPVVVVAEAERYVLIDGYLRVAALERLGCDTAAATQWTLSETEALMHHHHLGGASRSVLEEAWLLGRLRDQGVSLDEMGRRMCRSKSWVSRRLGLMRELSQTVQERVRAGTLPPHAAMKYLVPLARANRRDCDALVAALGQERVSVREVEALYNGWRRADGLGRKRLIADPLLYLRALAAQAASEEDALVGLIKDLATLGQVAWRARQRVASGEVAVDDVYRGVELNAAWNGAKTAFTALCAQFEESRKDVGPEHQNDDSPAA